MWIDWPSIEEQKLAMSNPDTTLDFLDPPAPMPAVKPDPNQPIAPGTVAIAPAPPYDPITWAGFNTWDGKNSAQWWAIALAAADRHDWTARDEAISVARSLTEADDITRRFESLPLIQRYRAAQTREREAPVPT